MKQAAPLNSSTQRQRKQYLQFQEAGRYQKILCYHHPRCEKSFQLSTMAIYDMIPKLDECAHLQGIFCVARTDTGLLRISPYCNSGSTRTFAALYNLNQSWWIKTEAVLFSSRKLKDVLRFRVGHHVMESEHFIKYIGVNMEHQLAYVVASLSQLIHSIIHSSRPLMFRHIGANYLQYID